MLTRKRWWKREIEDKDCVLIGQVKYHKTKMPRACRHCGYVFPGKRSDLFCSDVCREQFNLKNLEKMRERQAVKRAAAKVTLKPRPEAKPKAEPKPRPPRVEKQANICPVCGKSFIPNRPERKTCSPECRAASLTSNLTYECLACGKTFKPKRHSQKTCSPECGHRILERKIITCPVCGKNFKPAHHRYVTCSKSCGGKWRRMRGQVNANT